MRILVIANLPPHVMGGAENQVARLVSEWVRLGHSVEVAGHCIPNGEQVLGTARVRTHRILTTTRVGRFSRGLSYALSLAWIVVRRRRGIDVVYCRGLGDGALTLVALRAFGLHRVPLVVCPINALGRGDTTFIQSVPGWRYWVHWADRHIHTINLINEQIQHELASIGIKSPRLTHVPNGIVLHAATTRVGTRAVKHLCWTGRLDYQKGLDLLIQALSRLASEGFEFHLSLIGDGDIRASLEKQVESLGLSGQVQFFGGVSPDMIRPCLLSADVFVLPSRWEGMSNSALEAMESGLPIVCTRCGGIDQYVQGAAGWVCEPDSDVELEHVLRQMLLATEQQLLEKGRIARKIVEDNFRIETVAARNLNFLQEAADSRPRE